MKLRWTAPVVAFVCLSGMSHADTAQNVVNACIKETRAAGAYTISDRNAVPRVAAAEGGSASGARNINDCVHDKFGVQYGYAEGAVATSVVGEDLIAECKRIRNRRIGASVAFATGFAIGVGDSLRNAAILGGLAGVGITANREYKSYEDCIASGTATVNVTYSRRCPIGTMTGGNGYCLKR